MPRRCARNSSRLLEQVSRNRSSLFRSFQHWRSRVSNDEFSVVDGRVYFQQASDAREAAVVLRLFTFMARHGVALSPETERRLNDAHRRLARDHAAGPVLVAASARDSESAACRRSAAHHALVKSVDPSASPSLRPSICWSCATFITGTQSTSIRFWRSMCCIS